MNSVTLEHVKTALSLTNFDAEIAQGKMAPVVRPMARPEEKPGNPRLAAVLVLLFPTDKGLSFVLTKRGEYEGVHSGQISLPGGRRELGETFAQTALRETEEEIGICAQDVTLIGELNQLYIPPSDFEVHPFVGTLRQHPVWKPDPTEVAEVIETPTSVLLDDTIKAREPWTRDGMTFNVPFYRVKGHKVWHKVWGATAIILSELEGRLRQVLT